MTPEEYDEEFSRLWESLVPAAGESATVQGEMVRAIGRLRHECVVNGNFNWDDSSYYRSLTDFLELHLCSVLSSEDLADNVEDIREAIVAARNYTHCDAESLDYLVSVVVDWCRAHPDPILR